MRAKLRAGTSVFAVGLCGLILAGCGSAPKGPPPLTVDGTEYPVTSGYKVGRPYEVNGRWYYPAEDFSYDEVGIASWYGPNFHGKPTANGERYDMDAMTAAHKTLPLPSLVRVTNLENGRSVVLRVNDRGPFVDDRIIDLSRAAAHALDVHRKGLARVRVQNLSEASLALKNRALGESDLPMPQIASAPRTTVATNTLPPPEPRAAQAEVATPQMAARETASSAAISSQPLDAPASQTTQIASAPLASPGSAIIAPTGGHTYVQAGAFSDLNNALRVEAQLTDVGDAFVTETQVNGQTFYRVRLGPWASDVDAGSVLSQVQAAGYPDAQTVIDPNQMRPQT